MIPQLELIDKVKQVSLDDDRISAVLMYGSFTRNEGDAFSDVEFYVFVQEGCAVDKREWISSVRPVDLLFTNEFGTDVAVFNNLIRGEFHFHSITEVEVIHTWQGFLNFDVRDKMNLVDKDGVLIDILNNIEQITPEWNTSDNLAFVADSMINNLIFTGNVISRGEYARAESLFFFLKKYLLLLVRLHLNTTEHWLDPFKGLEEDIPTEWYERYKLCVPGFGVEDIKACFRNILTLTNELFGLLNVPQHNKIILERIMRKYKG